MAIPQEKLRLRLTEASEELVEPARQIIENGLNWVRQGEVNFDRQIVQLTAQDQRSKRVYRITDKYVRENADDSYTSLGNLYSGLEIEGYEITHEVVPFRRLTLPRSSDIADTFTIRDLRGLSLDQLRFLLNDLRNASLTPGAFNSIHSTQPK